MRILGSGQKNIRGARAFVKTQQFNDTDHLIIAVGSNDLADRSPDWCITETEIMIKEVKTRLPTGNIHIMPALERVDHSMYNIEVDSYNNKLKLVCAKHEVQYITTNNVISANKPYLFAEDKIHFNIKGCKALVRIIKTHMNEVLDMKPYGQYQIRQNPPIRYNNRGEDQKSPELLENFIKLLLKNR